MNSFSFIDFIDVKQRQCFTCGFGAIRDRWGIHCNKFHLRRSTSLKQVGSGLRLTLELNTQPRQTDTPVIEKQLHTCVGAPFNCCKWERAPNRIGNGKKRAAARGRDNQTYSYDPKSAIPNACNIYPTTFSKVNIALNNTIQSITNANILQ